MPEVYVPGAEPIRDEPLIPRQFQLTGINLSEDLIQGPRGSHLSCHISTTTAHFIGHDIHHVPFRWTNPLHRQSDTPAQSGPGRH